MKNFATWLRILQRDHMASKKKEELRLTPSETDKLIELYQDEVDLWNCSLRTYHNKDCRRKALENILTKLLEEFPNINGSSRCQTTNNHINCRCILVNTFILSGVIYTCSCTCMMFVEA